MTTPWSPAEIEQEAIAVVERLDEAVLDSREVHERAAGAVHLAKFARAQAQLKVSGRNKEERDARVFLHQHEPGVTVGHLEWLAELAEGEYRSELLRIRSLEKRADLFRSLLVSARASSAA